MEGMLIDWCIQHVPKREGRNIRLPEHDEVGAGRLGFGDPLVLV